ncbi:MAG: metallophosphoesterase, partial [Actinobacteria bacterium]
LIKDKLTFKLSGNHDLGCIGQMDLNSFTSSAKAACEYTAKILTEENKKYLESLELLETDDKSTLVHGSPREPVWEYILNEDIAFQNFSFFESPICFVGHTHLPVIFKKSKPHTLVSKPGEEIKLDINDKAIVNPGSVGQPRDGNPQSSYILFNEKKFTVIFKRVPYDVKSTQEIMKKDKLPESLIERLGHGL